METPGRVVLLLLLPLSCSVRLLSYSPLRCPRQDVTCTASHSNCFDGNWSLWSEYTPSEPENLKVGFEIKQDEDGELQPVLTADWTIRDDGSITSLRATELHLLVLSTNQNMCVRYTFEDRLPMRSPSGEKWRFSANMLVLDPGHQYRVSVFNIPKPQNDHSIYDVSSEFTSPDCSHSEMKKTQFCTETGSLWSPNISVSSTDSALTVSFSSDSHCEEYQLIIGCSSHTYTHLSSRSGDERINLSFSLDQWPRTCCLFQVEINPLFPRCFYDCRRLVTSQNICPESEPPSAPAPHTLVIVGVLSACALAAVCVYFLCRRPGKPLAFWLQQKAPVLPVKPVDQVLQVEQVTRRPKVLLIYSHDHRLYRNVVLHLCAFLQDRCGAEVLVDLLDSASLGLVGGARWLHMQQRRLEPGDKVLLLCSKGVQAKWRALCGEAQVTLREDEFSPSDDILTAFLNLFLPSMHRAGALGTYVVAYFEELSDEHDVPSLFHISVKYALMKDVEEMLFRILDIHKYEPGRVRHVHGVHVHDYFNCPSGRSLRGAIQAFQEHQRQHPDWFQRECVCEEELDQMDQCVNPHTAPMNPHTAPMNPYTTPMNPHTAPMNPHTTPMNPHSAPMNPYTAPMNPYTTPMNPHTAPMNPHTTPMNPHTAPMNPYTTPMNPHTTPMNPHTTPMNPYTPPINPHTTPMNPHTTPMNPHTTPMNPYTPPMNPHTAPVLQCVPVIRAGLPAFRSEVNVHPESAHIHTQRPLLSDTMSPLLEGRSQDWDSAPRGESDQGYVSKSSSQNVLDLVRLQKALLEQSLRAPPLYDEL